ncbi:MAG: YjgP/YjgQ family permease [Epsilonproteobacteria bacterium]|nr:YjgP/YjgQ family permease [Campylobacterota bacterium]
MFWYVFKHYAKNMLTVLLALSLLFTGLDFLMTNSSLPSFNIKVLYIFNRWQESLNLLYPLAIAFGAIWTKISFIKNNTLIALYSLGVSQRDIFKPFLALAILTYVIFVGLNFTQFALASDIARAIKKGRYNISNSTDDMFFKYNSSFIYAKRLIVKESRFEGLKIFIIDGQDVVELQEAKEAIFKDGYWLAKDVTIKRVVDDKSRLEISHRDTLITLKGYNPKILNSIYENRRLTLYESVMADRLLLAQGITTTKIRADIYSKVLTPLFSITILIILIFSIPSHARYLNMVIVTAQTLGGTLFMWGVLFALNRMGQNGVISPELASILPIALLSILALYIYSSSNSRI